MSSPERRGNHHRRRPGDNDYRLHLFGIVDPTKAVELAGGLSLSPRVKLLLTVYRADPAVRPFDEWRLRQALLNFLRSPPLSLKISDEGDALVLRRRPELHKLKRGEPVANGALYVRDLGFLKFKSRVDGGGEGNEEKRFVVWRRSVVEQLQGIELNIEGAKFRLSVEIPPADDFQSVKKSWEDQYAKQLLDRRFSSRARKPDTIVVRGVPSRWFAEPRVSSKPSMLVTHTIFSVLGKIRNINVTGDDDLGKNTEAANGEFLSGLDCKILVQFESYEDFHNAMKVLCGRSLQKEGSRLKVDYEVSWDRDGFFRNMQQRPSHDQIQESSGRVQPASDHVRNQVQRHHRSDPVQPDHEAPRSKRFRE